MTTNPDHIRALRQQMATDGLDGFVVPLTDEHMSEYVGDYAQRLAWLTGFEGSAGNAIVLKDKAAIFVDGRYTLQVKDQVEESLFEAHQMEEYPLLKWTADHMGSGARIGYDPELATSSWVADANAKISAAGGDLVPVQSNPIDRAWGDRPEEPGDPVVPHGEEFAGQSSAEKRGEIAARLATSGADALVVAMLDSVAWLFNVRGRDVKNTPVPHGFAVLEKDGQAAFYVAPDKVSDALREHLGNEVRLAPRTDFYDDLGALGKAGKRVLVDKATCNAKIIQTLKENGAEIVEGDDPTVLMKAVKNEAEMVGARTAHIRDGAAICDFLAWFARTAPVGELTELDVVAELRRCREKTGCLKDDSFDTISGSGPNGAIIHYRVTAETNRAISPGEVFLLDSGGQYEDGTTDITRTMPVGDLIPEIAAEVRKRFTLVLQGHIALATARFPKGTSGMALDTLARRPLWQAGLEYDHGTGHGVGSYLAVHEGPQRIAKFGTSVPLEPGMILSNEPGYYKPGAYGIRIENLILVQPCTEKTERDMLCFETLTLAPIDRHMIEVSLMSADELSWLNAYHRRVRAVLLDRVAPETKDWLVAMTEPL